MTTITKETTLLELFNAAAKAPELLKLSLGAAAVLAEANSAKRKDGLSSKMTVSEFYAAYYSRYVSDANGVKPATKYYREYALKLWEEIIGFPALEEITQETTADFVLGLKERERRGRKMRNATIRKHCRAISAILKTAGPRSERAPYATGLIPFAPPFPTVHVRLNISGKTPTLRQFKAILDACEHMKTNMSRIYPPETTPEGLRITAPEWWRALYLLLYNTGVRRGELFSATWGQIRSMNGRVMLYIPAESEKRGMEKFIPLNAGAIEALNLLPRRGADDLILGNVGTKTSLWRGRKSIAERAQVPIAMTSPHAMRRMVETYVENPQKVLGHANAATTRNHYTALEAVGRYLDELPQPE